MIGDALRLNLDVVKFSLDKGDLTGYYIHNGKSVRLQTLFSNALNYDWFIQSIFISNPLLTRFLVILHLEEKGLKFYKKQKLLKIFVHICQAF